jgi:hypothetical protein
VTCVRWYVAYPLSLRHIEATMQERGVFALRAIWLPDTGHLPLPTYRPELTFWKADSQ